MVDCYLMACHASPVSKDEIESSARMKTALGIFLMLFLAAGARSEMFTGEMLNKPFTVHGRLRCYNGGSTLRIWIIGSKRMLYVPWDETSPAIERLNKYYTDADAWFKQDIFADFTVAPLASDIKGRMRPIRILRIKHVVITQDETIVARREEL